MASSDNPKETASYVSKVIEVIIRVGILILIFGWCFRILAPFLSPVLWGLIIAIAIHPFFKTIEKALKGRTKWAALLLTLLMLSVLLIPAFFLADSLWTGVTHLRDLYSTGQLIPPPGEKVNSWPPLLKPVVDLWKLASVNLQGAILKFGPELQTAGTFILGVLAGTSIGVLQFLISIIIAGVFLGYARQGGETARTIFTRVAGSQGIHFADLSEKTIRNVVKGVLGVAIIQTLMAGVGFVVAGVPAAGLWTLLCLIFAIVQIGVGPIAIGVCIYMFATADTLTASLLAGWTLLVTASDNILKPFLLGKGAPVPMLVVLLGSIGGLVANGFLGLFLGPVLLTLGYTLFNAWIKPEEPEEVAGS